MLKALICLGPEVTTAHLAEALWPDAEGDQAQSNLSASVHRLRKLLGREDAIVQREGKLSLNPKVVWVDAYAFERLASRSPAPAGQPTADVLRFAEQACAMYAGHLFAGESPSWMTSARERLRTRYQKLALALGASQEKAGQHEAAARIYERLIEREPTSELAHRQLMQALARGGRVAEARDVYQRCRRMLASTLAASPAAETLAVFESLGG